MAEDKLAYCLNCRSEVVLTRKGKTVYTTPWWFWHLAVLFARWITAWRESRGIGAWRCPQCGSRQYEKRQR